jgi:hypothetical protein
VEYSFNCTSFNYSVYNDNCEITWDEAKDYCRDQGGVLAILDTDEKRYCVNKNIQSKSAPDKYWVGLRYTLKWGNRIAASNDQHLYELHKELCYFIQKTDNISNNYFNKKECDKNTKFICEYRISRASYSGKVS